MKTTIHLFKLIFIYALVATNWSCSKSDESPEPDLIVISEESTGLEPTVIDNITEVIYPTDFAEGQELFDWENLTQLPLPANNLPVPMPWSDKAKRKFSDDIRNDYKKSDGWELYISSFSTKFRLGNLTFSLYNKYRGVLRFYFFIGSGTQKVQDYNILRNYVYSSEGSPLLNFTSQYIVDINKNVTHSLGFEPQSLADSSWYAVEYELAFDKNIYTKNSDFMMGSDFSMVKKNFLSINGKEFNDLNVKIRVFDEGKAVNNTVSADAYYIISGNKDLNQVTSTLNGMDFNYLNNLTDENILSGNIHKPSERNFKWDTKLDLHLAPNGVGLLNESYAVSGSNLSNIQGLGPFYARALGIFYLNKKPLYVKTENSEGPYPYVYTLDVMSVEYLFNPSVLEIAEIENLQQELIATEPAFLITETKRANLYTGQILKSNKPLHI